jgi:hypothetical protein
MQPSRLPSLHSINFRFGRSPSSGRILLWSDLWPDHQLAHWHSTCTAPSRSGFPRISFVPYNFIRLFTQGDLVFCPHHEH